MIRRLLSNDFNKNVLKLITGTTMAQAIPIAIAPILTRIYTPEDFGLLALFIAIASILGSIANGRYELAIVLPEKEEDSINLAALSVLISSSLSIILLVIVLLFGSQLAIMLGNEDIEFWLYFIPMIVFFIGLFNVLNYLNTRMKNFGLIAKVKVIKSLALVTCQLALGFLTPGSTGLIGGQLISHILANGKLAKEVVNDKKLISEINKKSIIIQAKRYIRFPKITLWATLSNSLSLNSMNIFISIMYSSSTLGFYSVVQKVLGMPTTLISRSIGQVFFEKANADRNRLGNAQECFKSTLLKLLVIGVCIFGPLFFVVEDLFTFVFGEEWTIAGEYARILIPLIFIRFIATPLTLITIIFEKQNIDLIWQILLLTLTLITFLIAWIFKLNVIDFLLVYILVLSVHYIVSIIIAYNVSR